MKKNDFKKIKNYVKRCITNNKQIDEIELFRLLEEIRKNRKIDDISFDDCDDIVKYITGINEKEN